MINNTFELLWRDISPFAVGFDRTFDSLALLANSKQESSNYPPYNIRKVSEDKYTIELAVAGFEEEEIDIEASGENLAIKGSKDKDASEGLLHQGLASRNFVKRFVLSDDMVIKGAALSNGMLYIGIERIIPEEKKTRKIEFTSKSKLLS